MVLSYGASSAKFAQPSAIAFQIRMNTIEEENIEMENINMDEIDNEAPLGNHLSEYFSHHFLNSNCLKRNMPMNID